VTVLYHRCKNNILKILIHYIIIIIQPKFYYVYNRVTDLYKVLSSHAGASINDNSPKWRVFVGEGDR